MKRLKRILPLMILVFAISSIAAQRGESPIRIFGYFQNSFQQWTEEDNRQELNSFSLQQLNLFFQKDLARNWTAFINFEFLNNFSSIRQWGSANLEEAWVKFRLNEKFNLKLGLQIPIFNNLNTIKNRTPLLPYIIRPIAYETSFNEIIPLEELAPARAFAQVYGFLSAGKLKVDYAAYLGNSPNINNDRNRGPTGLDTSNTILVGGRLGIRFRELKLGISATRENRGDFRSLAPLFGRPLSALEEVPSVRLGGDFSLNVANFSFESEFINVNINDNIPEFELDLDFYYGTLGYYLTDQLFLYGSYWVIKSRIELLFLQNGFIDDEEVVVPNAGISYNLNDRIHLKGQFARVRDHDIEFDSSGVLNSDTKDNFSVYALAVSIFF